MEKPKNIPRFKLKDMPSLLAETFKAWMANNPFRLSAVVAYYTIFSLPGLLMIIMNAFGAVWGMETVQGRLTAEISETLGMDVASSLATMLQATQDNDKNTLWTVLGFGTVIFGATGVFYQLKLSLNELWEIKPDPNVKIWKYIKDRVLSFVFILVIGFLLLISFVITALISALSDYIREVLPNSLLFLVYVIDFMVSIGIISVLFAVMFKYLPDAKIQWKTVWIGAIITAVLFVIGKLLLGIYFGKADFGSTYGTAGNIVVILLWVSYSSLLVFFGAQFTYVYAKRYGIGIEPNTSATEI